jgi:nickel/cobalt transporter (NicO) family protein
VDLTLALATALLAGMIHAFDPDHVAAVTTFVSRRPRPREALGFGIRWALGHSAAILVAGLVLIALGVRIPAALDEGLEVLVGVILIGLGIWLFRRLREKETDAPDTVSRRGTVWVGVVHGLAGTAALLALLPVTLIASPVASAAYLGAFGIGTIGAMAAYGVVAGWLFRRAGRVHPRWLTGIRATAATASVAIGVLWIGAVVL